MAAAKEEARGIRQFLPLSPPPQKKNETNVEVTKITVRPHQLLLLEEKSLLFPSFKKTEAATISGTRSKLCARTYARFDDFVLCMYAYDICACVYLYAIENVRHLI